MPKAVCLIGGDGTGKTAHAKKIVTDLQKAGAKCSYVWFGQPYLLAYLFMFLCNRLGYTKNHLLPNRTVCQEHQYYLNGALAFVWPWLQLFDLTFLMLARVYLPAWRGITVVCDRFVYDTMVELMADTRDDKLHQRTVGKAIAALKPPFARVFRLSVNVETAFSRRDDVPDLRFLKVRSDNYQLITKAFNIQTIDAEQPFDTVQQNIMKHLKG